MNLLEKLFRRNLPKPRDADHLRELVFAAAAGRDQHTFEKLCQEHTETIIQNFEKWQRVPEELRQKRAELRSYGDGLESVANYFAENLGRRELLDLLIVPDVPSLFTQWDNRLDEADALIAHRCYEEADDFLRTLLWHVQAHLGPEIGRYLALIQERIGLCHFHLGRTEAAQGALETALRIWQGYGDEDGILACLSSLYEAHRYLGHPVDAGLCAEKLSTLLKGLGRAAEAARWNRKATMVRAGEPLNRVVVEINGEEYEIHEAPVVCSETAKMLFERNRLTFNPVIELVKQGQHLVVSRQFQKALALFQQAAQADPYYPDPHYQSGLALLYLRRYTEAAQSYARAEELAPGWFECRTYKWLAEQLAAGWISHQTFLILCELDGETQSPEESVAMAAEALRKTPDIALLYLYYANHLHEAGNRGEAEAACRKGLAYAAEPDVETRLLAKLGMLVESPQEKQRIFQQAVALNGNLVAATAAALALKSARPQ